jgi:magnesium transporter
VENDDQIATLASPERRVTPKPQPSEAKSFFRMQDGRVLPCEPEVAEIVCYNEPGQDEEAEMQALYNIDPHTLQSSLDPDELSRLEFEENHAAIIFKRPKSYCAGDNFLLKVTSTGLFLFQDFLVVVMPDDAPLFEGRSPFPVRNLQDVILRLLYQSIGHFEGHLKAISMLSDSIEKRLTLSSDNKHLLNMFSLEKSLVFILNSLSSNRTLFEKLRSSANRLKLSEEQREVLEDLNIEMKQSYRRAEIYAEILASLMDARASIVNNNQNQLIKRLTIVMLAVMLPQLVVSIFSMNVQLPLPGDAALWPFWFIAGLSIATAVLVFAIWRVKKW